MFAGIVSVAVLLPAVGAWWGAGMVHDAVARRAAAGNTATAQALAAQIERSYAERLATAKNLLVLLANGARLDSTLLDAERLSSPFCRLDLLTATGQLISTLPLATCAGQPVTPADLARPDQTVTLAPAVVDGTAVTSLLLRLNPVETRALGGKAAWLNVRFTTAGLLTPIAVGHDGSYGVVDAHSGLILASPVAATVGRRVASPAARRLMLSGHAGALQTYAPTLHRSILTAYQPIRGTPLGIFVNLPTAEAFADADHLRLVLLAGCAVLLGLGLSVASAVAVGLARRDRHVREQVAQMHRLATTDPLTGVANRTALHHALEASLSLVARGALGGVALVFLDLDGVKALNDRAGHATTDRMLIAVATDVAAALRPADTVARVGGDEFVVLAPGVTGSDEAYAFADKLCGVVRSSDLAGVDGPPIRLTASAGVALATADTALSTAAELLRRADLAMYQVKRRGGDGAHLDRANPSAATRAAVLTAADQSGV